MNIPQMISPVATQSAPSLVPMGPSIVSAGAPIDPGPPHPTLYLNNLNDKIPIKKLVPALSLLFSPFGHIIRIVAKSRLALKGQAWIVFESSDASKAALSALQGMRLWDRTMHIRFAKFPTSVNPQDYRVRHEYKAQSSRKYNLFILNCCNKCTFVTLTPVYTFNGFFQRRTGYPNFFHKTHIIE